MASSARIRASRAISFAAIVVIAPWAAFVVPNFPQMPWMYEPSGLILPVLGLVLAVASVALVVRSRRRGAVPVLVASAVAAPALVVPAAVALALAFAVPGWTGEHTGAAMLFVVSGLSGVASAFLLVPAWAAAARLAAPLVEPLRAVRRPRVGASIVLVAAVAAISLAFWIGGGTATTGAEPFLAWGGLTYALSWGALGISFMAVGVPAEAVRTRPQPAAARAQG